MHVVIFEGAYWKTFTPLALSRPVFALGTGMATLLEKQIRHTSPSRLTLWVRPEFEGFCRARIVPRLSIPTEINRPLEDEPALVISGRTLYLRKFEPPGQESAVIDENNLIHSAYVRSPGLGPADVINRTEKWLQLLDLPQAMPQSMMVESIWDLIKVNEASLIEDFTRLRDRPRAKVDSPAHRINDDDIFISETARVQPGVVLDASNGPIVVSEHVTIGANSVLQGPCYLGPYAHVRALTLIRPGTSIGMMCRVGGEINNSIMLGWSNKSHDGYLGDSYVGKWVNLGAGTATSNIKNTYGEISIKLGSREVPTGRRQLGSLIGDHTKTAILTRLMSGSYIGFCCMLAASGISPRFMPSYTYWTDRGQEPYRMDKALEVTRRVFTRRDREWTEVDEQIMAYVARVAPEVEA